MDKKLKNYMEIINKVTDENNQRLKEVINRIFSAIDKSIEGTALLENIEENNNREVEEIKNKILEELSKGKAFDAIREKLEREGYKWEVIKKARKIVKRNL